MANLLSKGGFLNYKAGLGLQAAASSTSCPSCGCAPAAVCMTCGSSPTSKIWSVTFSGVTNGATVSFGSCTGCSAAFNVTVVLSSPGTSTPFTGVYECAAGTVGTNFTGTAVTCTNVAGKELFNVSASCWYNGSGSSVTITTNSSPTGTYSLPAGHTLLLVNVTAHLTSASDTMAFYLDVAGQVDCSTIPTHTIPIVNGASQGLTDTGCVWSLASAVITLT
jgi:hypothetical protein